MKQFDVVVRSVVEKKYTFEGTSQTAVQLEFDRKVREGEIKLQGTVQAVLINPAFHIEDVPDEYEVQVSHPEPGRGAGPFYTVRHPGSGYTRSGFNLKWVVDKVSSAVSLGRSRQ